MFERVQLEMLVPDEALLRGRGRQAAGRWGDGFANQVTRRRGLRRAGADAWLAEHSVHALAAACVAVVSSRNLPVLSCIGAQSLHVLSPVCTAHEAPVRCHIMSSAPDSTSEPLPPPTTFAVLAIAQHLERETAPSEPMRAFAAAGLPVAANTRSHACVRCRFEAVGSVLPRRCFG